MEDTVLRKLTIQSAASINLLVGSGSDFDKFISRCVLFAVSFSVLKFIPASDRLLLYGIGTFVL